MKNDLNRSTRGINHFLHFKGDYESNSDRLFNSLPLFYRIMYLDQPNPWVEQINRFDFLRLATISSEFDSYHKNQIYDFLYKRINPINKKEITEIELFDFLYSPFLKIGNEEYSVHEFILGLGYNGGIHMIPDKKEKKINSLYENIFLKYPDFCLDSTKAISKVFIDIYNELYSLAVGDNNGHSPNVNYQAKIVVKNRKIDGILFEKSYMQFPIRAKKNKGIRICIELKIYNIPQRNPILAYGHRKNNELNLMIWQQNSKLISKVTTTNGSKTIVIDIEKHFDQYFMFEVAIYPNGKVSHSVNKTLKLVEDLGHEVHIIDGKIILGSNLDGKEFGTFYEKALITQSIDKTNTTRNLGIYALKILNINSQILPYNAVKREI